MTDAAHIRAPRRQSVLFLLALVTPCLVLAALGIQVTRQERQLELRRAADDRQRAISQIRADLLSELERVKRQVAAGRQPETAVLVASVREAKLVLPFDGEAHAVEVRRALATSGFGARIREAERQELADRRFDTATAHYRTAIAETRSPWERGYAALLLARAESKANRVRDAHEHYLALLQLPGELQDEYGIPFALYATAALRDSAADREIAVRALRAVAATMPRLTSPAIAMLREVAGRFGAADLLQPLDQKMKEREQAEALQKDFPRLLARLQSDEPIWVPYGDPFWLVSLDAPAGRALVAVAGGQLGALLGRSGTNVRFVQGKAGEPLGENFPGLRADVPVSLERNGSLAQLFLTLALMSVVGLTIVCGYLLWRDVRRSAILAETQSQFISSVSHELRTPLTSIRMFAESMRLEDEMDGEIRAQYLDTVLRESERLSRLVDNVLQFARIEQGRAVYDLRAISTSDAINGAIRAVAPLARQAGFHLEIRVDPALPSVLGDRDALEQAVLNLLGNAMKYSGESREISLRVEGEAAGVAIRVIDRGIGIAPEDQARIFERFYRVGADATGHIPGAGLGLTLVKHIAAAHGGSVSVESRLGQGSTFILRIPFASNRAEAQAAAAGAV